MITFNLDAKPQSEDLRFCNDYSAKIIRSAVSIPLLRHNKTDDKIESGLCDIHEIKNNKVVLVVNDFWFDDGEKLQAFHIKKSIEYLLREDCHSRMLLGDLKKICTKKNRIILLHNKNLKFIYSLTNVKFSPFNANGAFCGLYGIKEISNNHILLESNKYNSKHYNLIKFKFIKNNINDVKSYLSGKTDFTNPTTFPLILLEDNKEDLKCYKNYIFFNISFSNRKLLDSKYKDLRESIYKGIHREELVKAMSPLFCASYDFKMNSDRYDIVTTKKYKEPIYLTLGYDEFYPNKEICEFIKRKLEESNIFLILNKTDYYNRDTKFDLQLNLTTPDFIDDSFYYCSRYFELILKLTNSTKYKSFIKLKKDFLATGNKKYFEEIYGTINDLYVEIPLFIGNALYLSKNSNFNFVDLNFEVFDIDKI